MNDTPFRRIDLQAAAKQIMIEKGFEPAFPPQVQQELEELKAHPPKVEPTPNIRDLRNLLWSSIDNDTSRDLDQAEVAERLPNGETKVLVRIADVDTFVPKGSAIDAHAAKETTTVYTGVRNFPMLPEQLSPDARALLETEDKLSIVIEFVVGNDGSVYSSSAYRAIIRNKAQLPYNAVGAWLENGSAPPGKVGGSVDLQSQVKLQDASAQTLKDGRLRHGALNLETIEVRPVVLNDKVVDIAKQEKNRATELIEDFMSAANEVVARMLESNKVSSIRRVVKTPERWGRIVELAAKQGEQLPADPNSQMLNEFLIKRKAADPDHFP